VILSQFGFESIWPKHMIWGEMAPCSSVYLGRCNWFR